MQECSRLAWFFPQAAGIKGCIGGISRVCQVRTHERFGANSRWEWWSDGT